MELLRLAPPCATFSSILNGCARTRLRSIEFPEGIPGLNGEQSQRVRLGNALAEVAAVLMDVQHKAGNLYQLEQPGRSLMTSYGPVLKALQSTTSSGYQRGECAGGAPWRKPLVLYTSTAFAGRSLAAKCPGARAIPHCGGTHPREWTGPTSRARNGQRGQLLWPEGGYRKCGGADGKMAGTQARR